MHRFINIQRVRRHPIPAWPPLPISERRLLLAAGDITIISASIFGSLVIWAAYAERIVAWSRWREQAVWAFFILTGWSLWLLLSNLYNLQVAVDFRASSRRIVSGGGIIALAYLMLFFVTSPVFVLNIPPLPRLAPGMAVLSSTLLLLLWRSLYAYALNDPQARLRVLILGAGTAGTILSEEIIRNHRVHYQVIGFIDDDRSKHFRLINDVPVLGSHDHMAQVVQKYSINEIIVAISAEVRGTLFQSIMDCYEQGVVVTPMPLLYERLTGKIAVEHIGSQWYIALPLQQHAASTFFSLVKRLGDIVLGGIGCIVYMVMLPLIALAIKCDSPGPVIYVQERAGLSGRPFRVRKFRSMVQDAERGGQAQWAIKNDDRITRIGRLLRKTRLDELPQMINVFRGEMSLVGPRPERPQFIEQLQHQIPFYRTRLAAKPGLTGWAQVNYGYGSTTEDALIKLQYDLYYIKHQSPWLDMLILLRTIGVVFKMKGQ
jgi:exopolysaccharide biosynthesis polyprenyl glycosylphosphotransferase